MADETFREAIYRHIREIDPNASDEESSASAFLLASALLGPDPEAIAAALEMDAVMAGVYAERARRNHIWTADGVQSAPWEHPETGGVSFAMDGAIVDGGIERVGDDKFSVTPEGRARAARLMAR